MESYLLVALFIYFIVNAFLSGLSYEGDIALAVLMFFFGILFTIGAYSIGFFKALWWLFQDYTGITFWYHFNYTKLYRDLSEKELKKINTTANSERYKRDKWRSGIVHKYVRKINQRHNYTYNPS